MLDSTIKVLPEDVANKIAAGEIVERPAAVVKELVENSLDAEAKLINVRFSRGGKFSIVVEDDGFGMHKEEALLSIKRHATSKLHHIQDLDSLATFGFRGEAIPSIASVSKFRLMTCSSNDVHGAEIVIDGGKVVSVKDCAKFNGTKVIVENLFYNVPARRKFLKSDETESMNIISLIKNLALAELDVKFSLFQNGNVVFLSPNSKNLGDRINEVFKHDEKFIDFSYADGDYAMDGAICDPTFGNVCKKNMVVFVNNRLVKSNVVNYAIGDVLEPIFPNHRGILAYIFLKINPAMVDVNVHPMKKEVRFKNEMAVRGFIQKSLLDIFRKHDGMMVEKFVQWEPQPTLQKFQQLRFQSLQKGPLLQDCPATNSSGREIIRREIPFVEQKKLDISSTEEPSEHDWKFVGIAFGEIAIFEQRTGIIIFNIRLALSRVTYEKVMAQCDVTSSQQLLLPIEFSLSQDESDRFQRFLPIFLKNGFSIYSFGQYDYKIDAIPEWLSYQDAASLTHRLVAEDNPSPKNAQALNMEETFARCISQISTLENYRTQDSIKKLQNALLLCKNPLLCPLGNAIYFELSLADMGRRFGIKITH
ncbi:MAG: DNA mismatch repair endonuclease MutL [Puniceicoccales bacterium]|jgi:DNA mismatch repair protein MutL|nr:DNA mismatch repair endonuclease MutL [Puniceicoccales bacterium]